MLKRLLVVPVVLVTAAVLITIFVSNRHPVRLVLDPISDEPVLTFEAPLFLYLAAALLVGVVLGGMRTWLGQSHWRRSARHRAQEAMRWEAEAQRLQREREEALQASRPGTKSALASLGSPRPQGRGVAVVRR